MPQSHSRGRTQLELRHVFDQADTQSWYVSIYLQFGFTQAGAENNLAGWLSGKPLSRTIELLLDPKGGSRTFRKLWDSLRFFRRDYLTEAQARQQLRNSPWVLPAWVEGILKWAKKLVPAGTEPQEPEERAFQESARFEWHAPEGPRARFRIADLSLLGLTRPRYTIRVGNRRLASIFRQPNGSYAGADEVVLPCDQPQLLATLEDDEGQTQATQLLDLWDPSREVNLFTAGGAAVDSLQPLENGRTYLLQTAADLHVRPTPLLWRRVGGQQGRLWVLLEEWPPELCVYDPQHVLGRVRQS